MIFVSVGSQKFQFNRLLEKLDELVTKNIIQEEIIAQTGVSSYVPKNYKNIPFLDREEFSQYVDQCTTMITHGGTGAIIGAVKKGKKVIAVPRLAQFQEHVDDHQLQLIHQFDELNLICPCYKMEELGNVYQNLSHMTFQPYVSNTKVIVESIDDYLMSIL